MRRILILGCSGSGKSTLAVALGARLGLPVIHLDAHFWRPGWVEILSEKWPSKVTELLQGDRWVMDGNFVDTLAERLAACDTAIFLDRSRFTCLWRVFQRWLIYRGRTRPDLPDGCPERLDWEFYQWVWSFPEAVRPKVLAQLRACTGTKRILVLRSDREIAQFAAALMIES